MKSLFVSAAIAAAFIAPARAELVNDMPYVMALAYAEAIQLYCIDRGELNESLANAALSQIMITEIDMDAVRKIAADHLESDQSACPAAIAFVERATATLPNAALDRLTAARKAREEE